MRAKVFILGLVLSLPIWLGINFIQSGTEDFFVFQGAALDPRIFSAEVGAQFLPKVTEPVKKAGVEDFEAAAKAGLSIWLGENGKEKILYQKESSKILPIASLAKLITAQVVLENYDLSQPIAFSKKTASAAESTGNFKTGETFAVKDLLYSLLMESSNDAANAFAEVVGEEGFVDLMNLEAGKILGPSSGTGFFNPTGLDPKTIKEKINYSTAEDLAKISAYLLEKQPMIFEITKNQYFDLYDTNQVFHHKVISTNELLRKFPEIIGGKTGTTNEAGGCLLLISKSPDGKGVLINVLLGSRDRFGEMEKLMDWAKTAYKW